jgi:GNAT superfamily N-acetyltransferase
VTLSPQFRHSTAKVGPAGQADASDFLDMWLLFLLETYHDTLKERHKIVQARLKLAGDLIDAYLTRGLDGTVLIARDASGRAIAGLLWGEGPDTPLIDHAERYAQGWGTYVRPSHRRQGVASAMWREGKRRLAVLGFNRIAVLPRADDDRVLRQLAKCGFKPAEVVMVADVKG